MVDECHMAHDELLRFVPDGAGEDLHDRLHSDLGLTWGLRHAVSGAARGSAAKRGEFFEERRERTINPRFSSVNGTFVDACASLELWRASCRVYPNDDSNCRPCTSGDARAYI